MNALTNSICALVCICSQVCARILGSVCMRRGYHLWLAAVVSVTPFLQGLGNPRSIFSNSNNFFNVKFVHCSCGWTFLLLSGFVLLVSLVPTRRPLLCLMHLARLGITTTLCQCIPFLFRILEDLTGSCLQPMPPGTLFLPRLETRQTCQAEGHQWQGYHISRQTFTLTLCSLSLAEELSVFVRYLKRGYPAGTSLRLVFLLNASLLGLYNLLLMCTALYTHEYTQSVVGVAMGTLFWHITYRGWYRTFYSPGPPGHGMFPRFAGGRNKLE
ncbi:fat storage-inducing transmembrane protein 1 [Rana temporaria]|uniref:fat storage-inducing transmembrane protein 1 n=1 Tax=Rana temporaria TaxID=8407 RepID=UPI001AACABE0|nr:fat storage-inducing transmembrane protein 1 [Rana temporaria]